MKVIFLYGDISKKEGGLYKKSKADSDFFLVGPSAINFFCLTSFLLQGTLLDDQPIFLELYRFCTTFICVGLITCFVTKLLQVR